MKSKVHDGAKNNCSRINCKMAVSNFGRTLSNAVSLSSNAIFHFVSTRRKVWTKIPIRLGGIFTRAFTIESKRFDRGKEKETRNSDAVFCVFARVYEQIRARTREESIKTWVTVDRCTSRSASNSIYLEAHRALEGL